ncbi:hypothetical protein [Algoriphagus sp.]|uniref:hypothetical protein n=1 Tax=Algoriphagus sp. TaxID=1872435 RepID=UPI00261DBC6E|nr:hypothetical protein [Algoriphagus sp.]
MKQLFFLFTLVLSCGLKLSAQETKNYKGGYTFNDLRGIGDFYYYLIEDNEAVLDGKFNFEYKKLDSLTRSSFLKLSVDGSYKSYKKDKDWVYKKAEHKIKIEDIQNRSIIAELESKFIDLKAHYKEGKLQGIWDYYENRWVGESAKEVFKAEDLVFQADKLTGKVRFESADGANTYQIFGLVNEKGLMNGNWDFFYSSDSISIHETRRYESGFLIGLSKVNSLTNEKIDEVVFYNAIEKLDSLNQGFEVDYSVSEEFFGLTFNDGFSEESQEYQGQYRGTYLLEDALTRILQFEQGNFIQEGNLVKSPISTRRFAYEISKKDKERYQEAIGIFDELQREAALKSRLDFLMLNQNTADSLSFSKAYFEYLNNKVKKFERVIDLLKSESIRFFDPSNYLRDGLDFLKESETIQYTYRGEVKTKELDFSAVEKANMLGEDLLNYLNQELAYFIEIEQYVSSQQQDFRQDKDLEAIESRILSEKGLIDSLRKSLRLTTDIHRTLVQAFYENLAVDQYQILLDQYNETEDFLDKASAGDEIIELLQFVLSRLPELDQYAGLGQQLQAEFTEKTLDPFTFESEFEVLRQAALVQAAQRIISYELNQIEQTKDFEVVRARLLTLESLKNRLLELKGRNTKRLERNLNQAGSDINQLKKLLSL